MKPLIVRIVGTLLIALAVLSLMFRVLGGSAFAIASWPVALIVIAIGVFLLRQSRGLEGWTREAGNGARSASRREVSSG